MNGPEQLDSVIIQPSQQAQASVIWLHGLGADGHDFTDIVSALNLPSSLHVRFIFPHAPIRPITVNANMHMRAWYDIYSLGDLEREDKAGITEMTHSINALIQQEIDNGIASKQIVLAGFSQGGAMALFTGLHYDKPLAGILALSTYLPLIKNISPSDFDINRKTKIFMAHGQEDPVLPIQLGKQTFELLKNLGHPIEWRDYPMAHQVCNEEIKAIGQWLIKVFK